MKLTKLALLITFAVGSPMQSWADTWYPPLCRIISCRSIDENYQVILQSANSRGAEMSFGNQRLPLSRDLHHGQSKDGLTHICVGYSAFGDEEIKCVFTPPLMK